MDYENIAEEFVNEVNYCNYTRRRRTVSETEPHNVLPYELFCHTSERSSGKSRFSQSVSPPRAEVVSAANNGCMSPGCFSPTDVSMHEDCDARWKAAGSTKMVEWLNTGAQNRRAYAAEDQDVEMGEPGTSETEFRRRSGSHGLRDLFRMRPRCNSHGEKRTDATDGGGMTPGRGGSGNSGNGTSMSPGGTATASSSASSSTSSSVSRFKVFFDTFRHRANSDSLPHNRTQLHG